MSANQKYKSSLFSMLFDQPVKMLEIYNALSGRALPPDTLVMPATLEEALFMDRINDLAFVVDGRLVVLIEHQSTINKNMPLRMLIYLPRVYEKLLDNKSIYKIGLVKIPKPEFFVLYNGRDVYPDTTTLRLSNAFMDSPEEAAFGGMIELEVPVININRGHNSEMIQKSPILSGYVSFVAKVRELESTNLALTDTITEAVKYCVANGILVSTLSNISSEVLNMLTVEFKLEDAQRVWYEDGLEQGIEQGIEKGIEQGIEQGIGIGEERKSIELAKKFLALGITPEQIAEGTGLPLKQILSLRGT